VWGGWKAYSAFMLRGVVLDTLTPGRVNIVAVAPAAGYKIIVANQIAYLAEVEGDLAVGDMDRGGEEVTSQSRLPLRELLQTLQGDEKALGVLIMRLNDWSDTDTVLGTRVWKAEDLQKALDGDPVLTKKLESHINVDLDGVPLGVIDYKAVSEGIVVDSPVPMQVKVGNELRNLVGRVQEVYYPQFCLTVMNRMSERTPGDDDRTYLQGVYREIAEPIVKAGKGEDVRQSLRSRIDPERLKRLSYRPSQVLDNTAILLNDSHVTSASFSTYDVGNGEEACDVKIGLNEEGRMRLWKYSHDNQGFQLLFIVDTVAIAAPRITTELAESQVTIRRVPSKDLVADAVALLNEIITENK
jgi:hypothetical protein